MAISDKLLTQQELTAQAILESYRLRTHKIGRDIEKITRLKMKAQSTSGGITRVYSGEKYNHGDIVKDNVISACDLELRTKKTNIENSKITRKIRKVVLDTQGIDFNLGYILKRYYLDFDYPPITLIARELGYCDKTIVRKRNEAIRLFAKLYY